MEDLIKSYQESLRRIRQLREKAIKEEISEEEITYLNSMESDLKYIIEWLRSGRRPGNRRGIERRAAYQKERPIDPILIQKYYYYNPFTITNEKPKVSDWDYQRIQDALSVLTDREKEIYLMSRAGGLSYEQIARILVVSKSTIQDSIERSEQKMKKRISESLFCLS